VIGEQFTMLQTKEGQGKQLMPYKRLQHAISSSIEHFSLYYSCFACELLLHVCRTIAVLLLLLRLSPAHQSRH